MKLLRLDAPPWGQRSPWLPNCRARAHPMRPVVVQDRRPWKTQRFTRPRASPLPVKSKGTTEISEFTRILRVGPRISPAPNETGVRVKATIPPWTHAESCAELMLVTRSGTVPRARLSARPSPRPPIHTGPQRFSSDPLLDPDSNNPPNLDLGLVVKEPHWIPIRTAPPKPGP